MPSEPNLIFSWVHSRPTERDPDHDGSNEIQLLPYKDKELGMEVLIGLNHPRGVHCAIEVHIDNEYLGMDHVPVLGAEVEYSMKTYTYVEGSITHTQAS